MTYKEIISKYICNKPRNDQLIHKNETINY